MADTADKPEADNNTNKFGPVHLSPGVTKWNARTYVLSAFWTTGFLSFLSFLQNYVLKEHLGMQEQELGHAVARLALTGEIVFLLVSPLFGALSDKIGRRPIFALGFLWVGVGFVLYPLASSFGMLLLFKGFMGVGAAALGGMMATVLSDYPQNRSRGLMSAISGWANGFGALFMIFVLSRVPSFLVDKGFNAQDAGTYTFWLMSIMAAMTATIVFLGLKAGKPGKPQVRKKTIALVKEGFSEAKGNPRLQLAFAESFIARGDLLLVGTFLSLWLIHTGTSMHDMQIQDATKQAGRLSGLVHFSALMWAPVFGYIIDKFDRTTTVIIAMFLAALGYGSIGFMPDPTAAYATIPLILLGIGELSAIIAGQTLVAQEAKIDVRGSVLGVFAFCGALGLIVLSQAAGFLFSAIGPGAPFVFVGAVNGLVMLFAIYVRVKTGFKSPKEK